MKRVFIPNRGEIALRIVQACRKLEIETVVGCSDIDKDGLAARSADRAVVIGPGAAAKSYLRVDAIIQAALGTRCDAIHPGYGFLAENPELAARAAAHGLTFVGPPPDVMELTGDKLRARAEAERAGVPVLPGREITHARDAADLGYPLLIKAAGGGGGRGIRRAYDEDELNAQLSVARSEAGAAFGDDRVYAERFIAAARHVEVQVAADEHGATLHLGERDCSVQRRYQKVIEEAPARAAPGMAEAAVRLAAELGYRNLGTVEFIVDAETGEFFFLEINCRIQVEHPVTEAVTRRDLVALQLQIADGNPLGFAQEDVHFHGHAIECRLNAEDITRGFMPTPGTLSLFSIPDIRGLRVDTHCYPGATVPPYYDSLLAKLIAHGSHRDEAIQILEGALEETDIDGVETNRTLLISVLGHPDFAAGGVTTDWLEKAMTAS
jgi:acetyl-CoA carboxylase, biotin carboxylase subunit